MLKNEKHDGGAAVSGKLDILCEAQKAGCIVGAGMHGILDSTGSVRLQNRDRFNGDLMLPFKVKESKLSGVCFSLPSFPVTLLLFFDLAINVSPSETCPEPWPQSGVTPSVVSFIILP